MLKQFITCFRSEPTEQNLIANGTGEKTISGPDWHNYSTQNKFLTLNNKYI